MWEEEIMELARHLTTTALFVENRRLVWEGCPKGRRIKSKLGSDGTKVCKGCCAWSGCQDGKRPQVQTCGNTKDGDQVGWIRVDLWID